MVGVRAQVLSFIGKLGNSPDDRASRVRFPFRVIASLSAQALIELERKIREQEELEERLEALESVLKARSAR
jgi:hypothetical protein